MLARSSISLIAIMFSGLSFGNNRNKREYTDNAWIERRLIKDLMSTYDRSARPIINITDQVKVQLSLTLTQIVDIDERNQVLTLHGWLKQGWSDQKLQWNPKKYGGLKILRIPSEMVWLPDIVMYNSVDFYRVARASGRVSISHDSHVMFSQLIRFRSSCKIDITYFPFDDQVCYLRFGSWSYDGDSVDVSNAADQLDLSNYIDASQWALIDSASRRRINYYECCDEPYPDVTFYLHVRRRSSYHVVNVLVPCLLLSALSLAVFLLPARASEKILLSLTVLLTFSIFMAMIAENTPATPEFVPIIGMYVTVSTSLAALSVVCSVLSLYGYHNSQFKYRPPKILRQVASYLADKHYKSFKQSNMEGNSNSNTHPISFTTLKLNDLSKGSAAHTEQLLSMQNHCEALKLRFILQEWRMIVAVVDRLLSLMFALISVSVAIALLFVKPMLKDTKIEDSFLSEIGSRE